ncbi:hypothetical protein M5X17_31165 [Paenibacillus alvei]|uniref:hypothetical protein n=1 Tax=Paenibacillus alvei TaxID=44250 RepID=UPI00227F373A|nr:hypothetical protein [Paenibacillus alvei]MCY9738154.1 hypothetical protein [Paenibacillus alvei]
MSKLEIEYGDVIVYETKQGEIRVGIYLNDRTVVFGDSLDSLVDKIIVHVYPAIQEVMDACEEIKNRTKK